MLEHLCSEGLELASETLRCYAERRDGDWEAICLDLDIAVQGGSFDEIFASLQEAISLYLETVADLPPRERHSLLDRPAPLKIWLKFVTHALRGLFGSSAGDREWHQFTMRLAA